ncbi:MAG: hypothetical protein IKX80_05355 [Lachnospiraceae bacterium]|nr:hypothetical protein [Lachnospiraceae bacterium]
MAESGFDMEALSRLPAEQAHKLLYKAVFGKEPDLDAPKDLNEKLQWLMVYRYGENVAPFADKLAVRDYVRKCGFEDTLPGLYAVYEDSSAIDIDALPERFILKCNHGSGPLFYSICKDKSKYDRAAEFVKLDRALGLDFSRVGLEYHYRYIKPYIYAEELLGDNCTDYKFFCFGGVPKYVKVIADRADKDESGKQIKHQDYYDMDWNFRPMVKDDNSMGGGLEKPALFERMKEIAAVLSEPFPMARVDLYQENGKVYFGEITLTPATGLNRTDKQETLDLFGELTDLDHWYPEKLGFERSGESEKLLKVAAEAKTENKKMNYSLINNMRKTAAAILADPQKLSTISMDDAKMVMKDCCTIIGSDADIALKCDYADILYRIAFREDMSLEQCWQIYWNLNRAFFVTDGLKLRQGSLDELYGYIFDFVKSMIDMSARPFISKEKRNGKRAVVITSQFLKVGHAPTRRVLDYSYTLQHEFGMQVTIINDAGMHYYLHPELEGVVEFNFLDEYCTADHIDHRGERFEFLQIGTLMPDLSVIGQLTDIIYSINPAFVFNIGGSSLVADLCDGFTTVASLPCAFTLAVSRCSNLLLGRRLEGDAKAQADAAFADIGRDLLPPGRGPIQQYQRVIETCFNYVYTDPGVTYTREQFGLSEDDFVACAVGHRLDDEINESFMEAVSEAVAADIGRTDAGSAESGQAQGDNARRKLRIVFVGAIESQERIIAMIPEKIREKCRERFVFTGPLEGASAFVKLADITLNPERSGGGRAAFEGYCFGKPSVSLRKGDAYWAGVYEFGAQTWKDYTELIFKLKTDSAFYAEMSKLARKRAEELSDITATQRKMLEDLGINT